MPIDSLGSLELAWLDILTHLSSECWYLISDMNFIDIYQLLQVSFSTGIMLYGGPQIAVKVLVDDQFIQFFKMCIKDWLN